MKAGLSLLRAALAKADRYPGLRRSVRRLSKRRTQIKVSGARNAIECGEASLSSVAFDVVGDDNRIEIDASCQLHGVTFFVRGSGHLISIGADCRFHRGGSIWFEDSAGVLRIGAGSTFEDVHLAVTERGSRIEIGRDCMFAYDIDVRTGDSHSILDAASGARLNPAQHVSIGDHVWVAAHTILLKGSSIAADSVVASGAVVTGSFEQAGVLLAGNPARVMKQGITWSRERV